MDGRTRLDDGVVTVVLCDLDGFRSVNDRLGHDAGDVLLREVASAWSAQVRAGELLARVGGDEFALLIETAQPVDTDALVNRLRNAVRGIASVSIGVAVAGHGEPADRVLRRADEGMYADKAVRRDHGRRTARRRPTSRSLRRSA